MVRRIFGRKSGATQTGVESETSMGAHLLFIGGEDHNLRIPFLTALASRGYDVTTAASADPAPFERAGIRYIRFDFNRTLILAP
jgi:hypothetical protein